MNYALTYGSIAGAIVIAITIVGIAFGLPNHEHSMWFGYLVMLCALSLIFVGVKRYRDIECGGVIRFGRAFGLGVGMAAVAGLIYVLGWEVYLATSSGDFMAEYSAAMLRRMAADGASRAAIEAAANEMRELTVNYRNPLFRIPLTFAEILPVGLIVALVSALVLRNSAVLPGRAVA